MDFPMLRESNKPNSHLRDAASIAKDKRETSWPKAKNEIWRRQPKQTKSLSKRTQDEKTKRGAKRQRE
jgi:hypothetical protein